MFNPRPKMANSSRFSVLWHFTLFGFSNFQTEREGGAKGDRLAILHALPSSEFLFSCHCQPAFAFRVTGGEAPSPSPSPAPSPSQSSCFWDLWAAESESKLPTGEIFAESDSKLAAASLGRRTLSGHGGNCYSITEVLVFSSLRCCDLRCVLQAKRYDLPMTRDQFPVPEVSPHSNCRCSSRSIAGSSIRSSCQRLRCRMIDACFACLHAPIPSSSWPPAALRAGLEVQLEFDPIGTDPPAPGIISSRGGCCSLLFSSAIATSVCSTLPEMGRNNSP